MEDNNNTLRSFEVNNIMKNLKELTERLTIIESDNSLKNKQLYNYDVEVRRLQQENLNLRNQINYYKQIESTLNNSMNMIKSTGEQIKNNALNERDTIIYDAKNNASRILNDALIKAEKIEIEADNLKKNVIIYKNKMRSLLQIQFDMIDDIEKLDF